MIDYFNIFTGSQANAIRCEGLELRESKAKQNVAKLHSSVSPAGLFDVVSPAGSASSSRNTHSEARVQVHSWSTSEFPSVVTVASAVSVGAEGWRGMVSVHGDSPDGYGKSPEEPTFHLTFNSVGHLL